MPQIPAEFKTRMTGKVTAGWINLSPMQKCEAVKALT
jgi:hypothetical protein